MSEPTADMNRARRQCEVAAGGVRWVFGLGGVVCTQEDGVRWLREEFGGFSVGRVVGISDRLRQFQGIVRVETQKPQPQSIVSQAQTEVEVCPYTDRN